MVIFDEKFFASNNESNEEKIDDVIFDNNRVLYVKYKGPCIACLMFKSCWAKADKEIVSPLYSICLSSTTFAVIASSLI